MSGVHAVLSASSSARWSACPGSVRASEGRPNVSSEFADLGSAAHKLAQMTLEDPRAHGQASTFSGGEIKIGERIFPIDDEMIRHVQTYLDYVAGIVACCNGTLLVEQRVPLDHVTGEEGAGGTSDVIIVSGDEQVIHVVDLKYGMGERVEAEGNTQAVLYGSGALRLVRELLGADPKHIVLHIHQPRIQNVSEWALPVTAEEGESLDRTVRELATAAEQTRDPKAPRVPGEKQCRWCLAKADCKELAAFVQGAIGADFEDLTELSMPALADKSTDELDGKMLAVDLVEDWCKAVRAETERRLLAGDTFAHFKLVAGRQGARSWMDERDAEAQMQSARLKIAEIYNYALKSPTQLEKALQDRPRLWSKFEAMITRSPPKPHVAPMSDKRPALVISPVQDDFTDNSGEDLAG